MKLTLLGTGTFFITKDRSSSSYLLEVDNKKILIDCGPGTLLRLSQVGLSPLDIDYVLITHFHADHTGDLYPFFMSLRLSDFSKNKPTKFPIIYGPVGIEKFMIKLSNIFELPCLETWIKVKFYDFKKSLKIDDIKVDTFKVGHNAFGTLAKAYSLRFEINGKIIAFSGDCVNCQGVIKACNSADLFVCDASYAKGQKNLAHMDTYDIGQICQKSKVKKVVLSHLYPQTDGVDLVSEVKENFSGEIIRGKDLMEIHI